MVNRFEEVPDDFHGFGPSHIPDVRGALLGLAGSGIEDLLDETESVGKGQERTGRGGGQRCNADELTIPFLEEHQGSNKNIEALQLVMLIQQLLLITVVDIQLIQKDVPLTTTMDRALIKMNSDQRPPAHCTIIDEQECGRCLAIWAKSSSVVCPAMLSLAVT